MESWFRKFSFSRLGDFQVPAKSLFFQGVFRLEKNEVSALQSDGNFPRIFCPWTSTCICRSTAVPIDWPGIWTLSAFRTPLGSWKKPKGSRASSSCLDMGYSAEVEGDAEKWWCSQSFEVLHTQITSKQQNFYRCGGKIRKIINLWRWLIVILNALNHRFGADVPFDQLTFCKRKRHLGYLPVSTEPMMMGGRATIPTKGINKKTNQVGCLGMCSM